MRASYKTYEREPGLYFRADPIEELAHDQVRTSRRGRIRATAGRFAQGGGFHQHQLAGELGISRRRIAYYESESEHPPSNLLADLARVLNVSTDQLLTDTQLSAAKASLSPRLERRLKQIERLSPKSSSSC